MKMRTWLTMLLVVMVGGFRVSSSLASEETEGGVARVSLINGDVSTMRGDSGDWVASTINAPLAQGDKISTGAKSSVEIQLDQSNIIRMDERTEVRIAVLADNRIQIQVGQGRVNYTLFSGSNAQTEIDTPNVALRPLEEGIYRVQVNSDNESEIICRKGSLEILTPEGSTRIGKNDLITVRGTENAQYKISRAPANDSWDKWNQDRDHVISDAQSWQYTNRNYTGAHELDRYGEWDNVPGYGQTWTPSSVDASWAPYSLGNWMWQPYWGWTWVSTEPWGWAPYHYGRWFVYGGRWRWWPGPVYPSYRPAWAPAYVSFLGFGFGGQNWSFGFGFGYNSIGWLPVGPCDHYYPWYGVRRGYGYNSVNITNVTNVRNVTNIYNGNEVAPLADRTTHPYYSNLQSALNNEKVRASVRSLPTQEFAKGAMATTARTPVDARSLRQAQLVAGTIPAVPTRESLKPVNRSVNLSSLPSRSTSSERYFSRTPTAAPQSFDQHASEIKQMVQRYNPQSASGQNVSNGAPNRAPVSSSMTTNGSAGRGAVTSGTGAQPITNRNPYGASQSPASSANATNDWSRFGNRSTGSRGNPVGTVEPQSVSPASAAPASPSRGAYNQGGWRTMDSSNSSGATTAPIERSTPQWQGRTESSSPRPVDNRNWSRFPSAGGSVPQNGGGNQINRYPRQESSQPTARPQSAAPTRQYWPTYQGNSQMRTERPPLQMGKPIVTERPSQSYGGGGYRGAQVERQSSGPQRGAGNNSAPSSHSSGQRGKR